MPEYQIVLLLRLFKEARAAGRVSFRRTRQKNIETLTSLGLLPSDMFDIVAALKPSQALCEPWNNRNPSHPDEMVCEFGAEADGREVYVKITAVGTKDGASGCVVSFHFPELPLEFPFK